MYKVTYKGFSKEEKAAKLEAFLTVAKPQDKRGKYYYRAKEKDPESVKEEKRKRRADWLKKREAEFKHEIEDADAHMVCHGLDLPKGKAVEVEDNHPFVEIPRNKRTGEVLGFSKAQSLSMAGVIELVKAGEEPEKRGPGRPPKVQE